ncbi:MAG: GNAT family N-acetyltransferase [Bdellovibrionales bacterium]
MKPLIVQNNPDTATHNFLLDAVLAQRPSDAPSLDRKSKPFAIIVKDALKRHCEEAQPTTQSSVASVPSDKLCKIVAGLLAYVHPGWCYIDLLWVEESKRNQGLGQALMQRAEQEAISRDCHSIWLWTQDFEAPGFYEKLGYARFTTFENFIPNHQRIGYRKRIAA